MKILVCGATGFIGKHLVNRFIQAGYDVVATGIESKEKLTVPWINKVTYIQHRIEDRVENLFEFCGRPDKAIFLTWPGLPNYQELFHFEENLFTSYFFIKNLVMNGLKDLTVLGTCFEYGLKNGPLSEEMIPAPDNPYALAKDTLRKFLQELLKVHPFDLKWIRLFYLYGEGQNKNSILEQLKTAIERKEKVFNMSAGEQLRDYLPVEKVVDYIARIVNKKGNIGIINCCSGNPISIRSLVEQYLEDHNKSIELNRGYYPYPKYEPMAFWGDTKKLSCVLEENND